MKRVLSVVGALAVAAIAVHYQARPPAPATVRANVEAPAADAVARGRLVYQAYGCAMCHGADAKGGFANLNSESAGKVPGLVMVKEGYLEKEVVQKILDGAPHIGKADAKGPTPPFRMPGWKDRMARSEAADLTKYLFSLYPKKAADDKWR